MPANVVPPEPAVDNNREDPLRQPIALPVTVSNVRVVRGDHCDEAVEVEVRGESVSWVGNSISGADILLHGIMSDEPSCVYAQLESGDDVRFFPTASADIGVIFRAFSAVAVIAEDAVNAQEEPMDDEVYARRPDGTVGMVDWDAILSVDTELMRYEDAEEDDESPSPPAEKSNGAT